MNSFLKEFIEQRKSTQAAPSGSIDSKAARAKMAPARKIEPLESNQLNYIIENKPPSKKVKEFIQERCNELSAKMMAK